MPRTARKKSFTNTYHIVVKGNDRQIIFEEKADFQEYLHILELYKKECHFKLFAYCLMSNHVHLIIQTTDTPLDIIFRKINTRYASWFNTKYQRSGHVQDGRFHSEPIENINYLRNAIRYIHNNPVKAGLEQAPGLSYQWSSIHEYKSGTNRLVDTAFIYSLFSCMEIMDSDNLQGEDHFIDIDNLRVRLTDDEAAEILKRKCSCSNVADFSAFPLVTRNEYLRKLHDAGLSIRQLNRITGVSRGVIQKVITNN